MQRSVLDVPEDTRGNNSKIAVHRMVEKHLQVPLQAPRNMQSVTTSWLARCYTGSGTVCSGWIT